MRPLRTIGLASAFWATSALVACRGSAPPGGASAGLELEPQDSGTDALLQAVAPVDEEVVWMSGHRGTVLRTTDGGTTWRRRPVPGADTLQFRDVAAFDSLTAVLMSAGTGPLSRLFRTDDGGTTWTETYVAPEPEAFLDCMDFWDERRGLVWGDAVAGGLYLLRTDDGGRSWSRIDPAGLPPALPGEGGFAASGTCLVTAPGGRAWIATGNGPRSRLLATEDHGRTWSATDLPLVAGEAAGATTVGFRDGGRGFALGGRIGGADDEQGVRAAFSDDRGRTWTAAPEAPGFGGPVYGAAWIGGSGAPALVAVGPEGLDVSPDGGRTWRTVDERSWWAVAFAAPDAGWAAGPEGRIARLRLRDR